MKKIIALIITTITISLSFCACGNESNTTAEAEKETEIITLDKDNIEDYISINMYCDNAQVQSLMGDYRHSWNAHIDVNPTGTYSFENATIDVYAFFQGTGVKKTYTVKLNGEGEANFVQNTGVLNSIPNTYQSVNYIKYEITNVTGTLTKTK